MDKRISELNAATALTGTEVLPIIQGGETKKVTAKAISDLGGAVSIGQVAFGTAAGVIGGDNGLFWDNVNKRLGVGTSTPGAFKLDVNGTARVQGDLTLNVGNVIRFGTALGLSKNLNKMLIYGGTGAGNVGGTDIHYWNGSTFVAGLILNNNANVLIGTTTDSGAKLHVQAQGALSSDIAFRVRNSANTANLFQVKGNGTLNAANLPTSATGLVAGDFWNDAGTLKIV